jgi:hypothetical protein
MQSKLKPRRLSAMAWREMVARFISSGLSAEAFSERERVSLASLQRWREQLSRDKSEGARSQGFVDLGSLRAPNSRFEIRLELGDGVLLMLSRS